ncbi:hypothetical protein [Robiginitalea sp.]|uniref:hypothetical protein n=1 Tax=Robiginitalea sp. TaxID=1902411 RepID=UPI003C74667A
MKMINLRGGFGSCWALTAVLISSCSPLQTDTESYDQAWEEVLESGKWETSLNELPNPPAENATYFALPEFSPSETTEASAEFVQRYPVLVSRAYFRLISEAMEADQDVARSYQELYRESRIPGNQNNPRKQQEFETAQRRYLAHREMLNGLRSWNAFNRYGSDDLDFFLKEEFEVTYAKYQRGVQEEALVDYLMRRLADLYHQQYGGLTSQEFLEG